MYWFCSLMETLLCGTILRFNNRYYLENEIVFTYTCKCIKGNESQTKSDLCCLEQDKNVQTFCASLVLSCLIIFKDLFNTSICSWENKKVLEVQDRLFMLLLFVPGFQTVCGGADPCAAGRECVMVISHFHLRNLLKSQIPRFKINQFIYKNIKRRRNRQNKHKQKV